MVHHKRIVVPLCLAAALLFLSPLMAGAQSEPPDRATEGVRATGAPPPFILRADPNNRPYHVAAPTRLQSGETTSAAATSTIVVNFLSSGTVWGESCKSWPTAPRNAFAYAASIWASLLVSSVPITIDACWTTLGSGVLGSAGGTEAYRDFAGAPQSGTWYLVAEANALYGSKLNDSGEAEILAAFSDAFSWYYGTDGNVPSNEYDLATVVLHEIGHGLGFVGSADGSTGTWGFSSGYPFAYDRFVEDVNGYAMLDTSLYPQGSSALKSLLTGNNLYFNGTQAKAANGNNRPRLYAPSRWSDGSSYSHLDTSFDGTANALMTYSIAAQESIHDPGPVALGVLGDQGWSETESAPTCYNLTLTHTGQGNDPVATPTSSTGCASGQYVAGESISLTGATAATSWHVASWTNTSNNTSTASTNSLTMPGNDTTVTVNYVRYCFALTLSHTGHGSDPTASPTSSSAAGCPAGQYISGQNVSLTASAGSSWKVASWSGTSSDTSTASTNSVTMTATDRTVAVNYDYTGTCYPLTGSHTGNGSDPVAAPTKTQGCTQTGTFAPGAMGDPITLTVVPDWGWWVRNWTGTSNDASTSFTNTVTMPASAWTVTVDYYKGTFSYLPLGRR